ncbi:MAG: HEAT repeat domain-containing protein, partial [Chloroflexota bacterium]
LNIARMAIALATRIHDEDEWVRVSVVKSLGDLGNIDAEDALLQALKDDNEWVRYHAALALASIKSTKAVDALTKRMHDDESNNVQRAISGALNMLGM